MSRRHLINSSDVFIIKGFTVYKYIYLNTKYLSVKRLLKTVSGRIYSVMINPKYLFRIHVLDLSRYGFCWWSGMIELPVICHVVGRWGLMMKLQRNTLLIHKSRLGSLGILCWFTIPDRVHLCYKYTFQSRWTRVKLGSNRSNPLYRPMWHGTSITDPPYSLSAVFLQYPVYHRPSLPTPL